MYTKIDPHSPRRRAAAAAPPPRQRIAATLPRRSAVTASPWLRRGAAEGEIFGVWAGAVEWVWAAVAAGTQPLGGAEAGAQARAGGSADVLVAVSEQNVRDAVQ